MVPYILKSVWVFALVIEMDPSKESGWDLKQHPAEQIAIAEQAELQGQMGAGSGKWRSYVVANHHEMMKENNSQLCKAPNFVDL